MLKIFEKTIQQVRVRCSINLLLKYAGQVLIIAGLIAMLAVVTDKIFALQLINPTTLTGFFIAIIAAILILWVTRQPSKLQISLLLDERMGLKERFSTALKISDKHDAFSEAACKEALGKAQSLNLQGHFPIKLEKGWAYTGTLWLVVAILFLAIPQKDLFGLQSRRKKENEIAKKKEEADAKVKEATESVKLAMKKISDPNIAEALGQLNHLPPGAKPQDVKREAIRKLGNLSEQVKNMQKSEALASMQMMQQMLKQLKGSPDSFSQQLRMELAKGNFGEAAALLKKIQNQLREGKMSPEQQKKLSEQMQALSKALEELAEQSDQFANELEKMGLSKDLAKMGQKELREALEKQGLSSEQIEEMMQKAAASSQARQKMSQMASAMAGSGRQGGGSGMSPGELSEAIEQLSGLESLQQQMMLTEMSLQQIANAINGLGQGMGQGMGQGKGQGQNPFSEGLSENLSEGSGGAGMGMGERDSDNSGEFSTEQEIVKKAPNEGPIIATWYFKDIQVEGQTKREFSEVIQAGREAAAEAISENEIPKRYEDAIKSYFGNIEESLPVQGGVLEE